MPFSLSTSAVSSSAVLPLGWVTSVLPLRSANDLMFAFDSATTWKYCGYRLATWHTLVTFFGYGGRPSSPSTVVLELASPICALPSSTPRTLAMPAPGVCVICRPGTAVSHMPFIAPPSGIQEPPCGPVMKVTCCAVAGTAKQAARASVDSLKWFICDPPPKGLDNSSPQNASDKVSRALRGAPGLMLLSPSTVG